MTGPRDGSPMDDTRVDVVMYPSGEVKAVPAGKGTAIVHSYEERKREWSLARRLLLWGIVAVVVAYSVLIVRNLLMGLFAAALVSVAFHVGIRFARNGAELLDDDVTLRDAREQWEAMPVPQVAPDERERPARYTRREREHAYE